MAAFPAKGEINSRLAGAAAAIARVEAHCGRGAGGGPTFDGPVVVPDWRFTQLVKHRTGGAPECKPRRYSADGANTHSLVSRFKFVYRQISPYRLRQANHRNNNDDKSKKRESQNQCIVNLSWCNAFVISPSCLAGCGSICEVSGLPFLYMHLLVALITLVVFVNAGGITDFIALARRQNVDRVNAVTAVKPDAEPDLQRRSGGV